MKLYLINLDRRADRLAAMAQESRKAGLSFTRIAAMDGQSPASQAPMRERFAAGGPLGPLPTGDRCCTLSHRRTWEALVESGAPYAAVFEDDVRLTAAAAALLTDAERGWLNLYHARVRDVIGPLVDEDTRKWLDRATRAI